MRIVHFSDPHFGVFPPDILSRPGKCLLGAANYWLRRRRHFQADMAARLAKQLPALAPDLVVCTGDLATVGIPEEFTLARKQLQPILDWAGERFVFVPGNHDAYVRDRLCQEALAETFQALNRGRWQLDQLPAVLFHDHVRLILIHAARPVPFWLSCGSLSENSLARLDALLQEPRRHAETRLAICHFPVFTRTGGTPGWRRGLQGGEGIRWHLLHNRLDALLCGHIHHPFVFTCPSQALQVCAGSLTLNGAFALIDVHTDSPIPRCQHIVLQ